MEYLLKRISPKRTSERDKATEFMGSNDSWIYKNKVIWQNLDLTRTVSNYETNQCLKMMHSALIYQ